MGQFLGPETDIMGERYFMALWNRMAQSSYVNSDGLVLVILCVHNFTKVRGYKSLSPAIILLNSLQNSHIFKTYKIVTACIQDL